MSFTMALVVVQAALAQDPAPLPEGNAFVQGLLGKQRRREEVLNDFTYDIFRVREELDKKGGVKERKSKLYEVFFVKGRPVRKLVQENDRPLSPGDAAKEERRVEKMVEAILKGKVVIEQPRGRLSEILERYDFQSVAREDVAGRPAIVLQFVPRPGKRDVKNDNVYRSLSGRLWVDEAEQEIVRAEVQNTSGIKFGFGLGASVSSLGFSVDFRKVDDAVWLPSRIETQAAGRILLVKGFKFRQTDEYRRYRRFRVDSEEAVRPSDP